MTRTESAADRSGRRASGVRIATLALAAVAALLAIAAPSFAHHPGEGLDQAMGSRERHFQAVDKAAPDFTLQDADGRTVRLSDFRDRIVVLNFAYARCPDVCPLHAEKIAEVQGMINGTAMAELVRFVTVTTDPANDTADVLRAYGPAHGLDPRTWSFLTAPPGQGEDATRRLAEAFGHKFTKTGDGYQMHGVVTHVIDRGGRWAANFHGLRFASVNLVLYLNGLANKSLPHAEEQRPGLWRRLEGLFH